jgi:transposase
MVSSGRPTLAKKKRLDDIQKLAIASIGWEMGEGASFDAKIMVEGLRHIRKAIQETEDKIEETCRQFPEYDYLMTIPGFGPDVSAKVLGAIGNPYRFFNQQQVLKMAGLDLGADRSGKRSQNAVPVISKQGKADLGICWTQYIKRGLVSQEYFRHSW